MKVLVNDKMVEVKDSLVKAINEQMLIDDARAIMPNYELIKPIEDFTRSELLRFSQLLESKMLNNNGDMEYGTLIDLGYYGE